ncbi:hypothetical protein ACH5RR_039525 [Cinchona calisaya]|uniref:Uncharacterized protein n=1 Tax=Cinchona calisaya TaxID=153742 RepID=A0ABD2Y3K1_9GENT
MLLEMAGSLGLSLVEKSLIRTTHVSVVSAVDEQIADMAKVTIDTNMVSKDNVADATNSADAANDEDSEIPMLEQQMQTVEAMHNLTMKTVSMQTDIMADG